MGKANEHLRIIDKEKTNFLRTVAHDLRTPLASIRAYAEMMLIYRDEPAEVQRDFLNIIVHESDRLGNLINNLLNLAKTELGIMQYEAMPVICEKIYDTMTLDIERKHLVSGRYLRPNLGA